MDLFTQVKSEANRFRGFRVLIIRSSKQTNIEYTAGSSALTLFEFLPY